MSAYCDVLLYYYGMYQHIELTSCFFVPPLSSLTHHSVGNTCCSVEPLKSLPSSYIVSSFRPPPRWYLVASLSIYRAMMMLLKPRCQGYWCAAIVAPTGYCCQLKLHVLAIRWGKEQRRAAWCCCCVCAAGLCGGRRCGCGLRRRRREQGGRESKEEVEIFWRSRELSHLPSTFYLCLTPST